MNKKEKARKNYLRELHHRADECEERYSTLKRIIFERFNSSNKRYVVARRSGDRDEVSASVAVLAMLGNIISSAGLEHDFEEWRRENITETHSVKPPEHRI